MWPKTLKSSLVLIYKTQHCDPSRDATFHREGIALVMKSEREEFIAY